MPTVTVEDKMDEDYSCIVEHPGFHAVCLNVWVLQTAYYTFQQHYGSEAYDGTIQTYVIHFLLTLSHVLLFIFRKYRHIAYHQFTQWCWG